MLAADRPSSRTPAGGGRLHRKMEIRRALLDACPELDATVIVVDVLRSFSTAAYALAAGARSIRLEASAEAARSLAATMPGALTVGSAPGGWAIPGFDLTNSPAALLRREVRGRDLVQCTSGGVRGLLTSTRADVLLAGSLVCARATARLVRRLAPARVTLVVTGVWTDRDGDEDYACADYIEALLADERVDPAPFEARVRGSDFAHRFTGEPESSHPSADIECCAVADRFDFALRAHRDGGQLVLRAAR